MFVERDLAPTLLRAAGAFPVVLLTGPRQSGKTTLLRMTFPDAHWISLDDPLERARAEEDPEGLLAEAQERPLLLDEVQNAPGLLPWIKRHVDRDRRPGRFLLSGSQQFALMAGVSESLAGRVGLLRLLPLSLGELARPLDAAVRDGCYPEPALHPEHRDLWVRSYLQTYVERDVRALLAVRDLRAFDHLVRLLAAVHGQLENRASLARELGTSEPTVKAWIGVLEASYVLGRLEPFHRDFGKRLRRSAKLYFLDPALPFALTRQPGAEAALAGPLGGPLFEGLVVAEALKASTNRGEEPAIWHWRSADGIEVDLLVQTPAGLVPVEIKLTRTPRAGHWQPLQRFVQLASGEATPGLLVCRVDEPQQLAHGHIALPWQHFPTWLREALG